MPRHGGRDIAPPLLRKILDDIRMSIEAFLAALRSQVPLPGFLARAPRLLSRYRMQFRLPSPRVLRKF